MAVDNNENIVIETSGMTASVATDIAIFGGITSHFQLIKLAYGVTGAATVVSGTNPLPVTVAAGLTATIAGFTGPITVQGSGGGAVTVSGTVNSVGVSGSPVYVSTQSGTRIEVTGGRPTSKSTDSVSVWGPNGITYIYTHLVDATGTGLGTSGGAIRVSIVEGTISATLGSSFSVQGICGGNPININDSSILNGITAMYGQIVGLRTDFASLGVGRPSTFKSGRVTVLSSSAGALDSSGYTTTAEIQIKALSTNTDFVFIGNTSGITYGYALDPGESVSLNVINTNKIYLLSNSGSQIITYFAS
jgi:hypothetical protein